MAFRVMNTIKATKLTVLIFAYSSSETSCLNFGGSGSILVLLLPAHFPGPPFLTPDIEVPPMAPFSSFSDQMTNHLIHKEVQLTSFPLMMIVGSSGLGG